MIEEEVRKLKITRSNFLKLMDGLTVAQLNQKPEGFNNNVIWNFGHSLISQQLLCYRLSGAKPRLDDQLINNYKKGSAPDQVLSSEQIQTLKEIAIPSADWMLEDYNSGILHENPFSAYTTSYNITLNTAEEAITFNNIHEGLHLGYAMALKRLL